MRLTGEDIRYIDEVHKIIKRGNYPSGERLLETYRRVLAEEIAKGKYRQTYNPKCGGCLKSMVEILYKCKEEFLDNFEKDLNNEETVEEQDREPQDISQHEQDGEVK